MGAEHVTGCVKASILALLRQNIHSLFFQTKGTKKLVGMIRKNSCPFPVRHCAAVLHVWQINLF
jgi:hypothetical protein